MAGLPTSVLLKSVYNKKFLRLTKSDDAELPEGFVKFDGEVVSQRAKFELEKAKNEENEGLVHIRNSYNNKYLVRTPGAQYGLWIVAEAQEPEEDRSKSSCTLFEPLLVDHADADIRVQFRHVQLGRYASVADNTVPLLELGMVLRSESPDEDSRDVYTLVDWKSLVLFPQHVAFKGDNSKYLCAYPDGDPYLSFLGDEKDEKADFEVFTTADGSLRIKSVYFEKFLRRSTLDWIWAKESDNSSEDADVLFWPTKVSNNVVALRNKGNNKFSERLTSHDKTDCLNAADNNISSLSRLVVEELAISRSIGNLDYRAVDGRIYNKSLITLATKEATNVSRTATRTYTLNLPYKDIKTSTWNDIVSFKLGVETTLQVSAVPRIVDGKIELSSAESSAVYQWGETNKTETDLEQPYTVVVPPRTVTTVALVATQGSSDVPFSYTQSDVLYNGNPNIKQMDDGHYTGTDYYNLSFTETQRKL